MVSCRQVFCCYSSGRRLRTFLRRITTRLVAGRLTVFNGMATMCAKCHKRLNVNARHNVLPCGHWFCSDCFHQMTFGPYIKCNVCSQAFTANEIKSAENRISSSKSNDVIKIGSGVGRGIAPVPASSNGSWKQKKPNATVAELLEDFSEVKVDRAEIPSTNTSGEGLASVIPSTNTSGEGLASVHSSSVRKQSHESMFHRSQIAEIFYSDSSKDTIFSNSIENINKKNGNEQQITARVANELSQEMDICSLASTQNFLTSQANSLKEPQKVASRENLQRLSMASTKSLPANSSLLPEKTSAIPENNLGQSKQTAQNLAVQKSRHNAQFGMSPLDDRSSTSTYGAPPGFMRALPSRYQNIDYGYLDQIGHRYVGLINQSMTCYLNALLQTLYMTPEFRNKFLLADYPSMTDNERKKHVPFQLRKLFYVLQTSTQSTVSTVELTQSFGWDQRKKYQQDDFMVQCRWLFEVLESEWNISTVKNLYRASYEDATRCDQCRHELVHTNELLELPLEICPFGAKQPYDSLEESLAGFIAEKRLTGENQYLCMSCRKMTDATQAFRIRRFPYILIVQLQRDKIGENNQLTRLSDRYEFPDILNLNHFIYVNSDSHAVQSDDTELIEYELSSKSKEVPLARENGHSKLARDCLNQGKYVYELFSVVVHCGGTRFGGHYYAYIKNMEQERWFCFNDANVRPCTWRDVADGTYGKIGDSRWSLRSLTKFFGLDSATASAPREHAYMLTYRRIDPRRNEKFVRLNELQSMHQVIGCGVDFREQRRQQSRRHHEAALMLEQQSDKAKNARKRCSVDDNDSENGSSSASGNIPPNDGRPFSKQPKKSSVQKQAKKNNKANRDGQRTSGKVANHR